MARPWSARCYGVARQRDGSRQNSIGGSGVLSLRQVPKKLARRRMVSAGAMLLDRLGPPGSGFTEFRFIDFRARVYLNCHPYSARARALMARPWSARCYGVARQREGSRQNSIGGSGVLSLRQVPKKLRAAKDGFGRRDAARPARAAWIWIY